MLISKCFQSIDGITINKGEIIKIYTLCSEGYYFKRNGILYLIKRCLVDGCKLDKTFNKLA